MTHAPRPDPSTALFGPAVDRSQESYRPSPYESRMVPPSGDVSPDGTTAYPAPSTTAKVLTWGGAGLAAAAVTAGGILAVRKIADMVSGQDRVTARADAAAEAARERVYAESRGQRPRTPRFAELSDEDRSAMHRRVRAEIAATEHVREGARDAAQISRAAPRPRRPETTLLDDVMRASGGLQGLVSSVSMALAGFRAVAQQAEGVVREFHGTADQIRGFLDESRARTRQADAGSFRKPRATDVVDLRDAPTPGLSEAAHDARTHRL